MVYLAFTYSTFLTVLYVTLQRQRTSLIVPVYFSEVKIWTPIGPPHHAWRKLAYPPASLFFFLHLLSRRVHVSLASVALRKNHTSNFHYVTQHDADAAGCCPILESLDLMLTPWYRGIGPEYLQSSSLARSLTRIQPSPGHKIRGERR